jgi:hypothetical protein
MEHCHLPINKISPIVSKTTVVETQRQPIGIVITPSLNAGITTT